MLDVKKMIDAILRQKINITEDTLLQMVEEKKQKIGAGYLTDQGALFLVAADLGIAIEESPRLEMSLKDLYAGAKEIT
ncbi:MAG: single-stranded DNA-binding protein, partial [Nitrososphaerales archaeon]